MKEIRCSQCGRKLMEVKGQAQISIKCPKCKHIILIKVLAESEDKNLNK